MQFTSEPTADTFPIVAIGASAGGIRALDGFLRAMPEADVHFALVILMHLASDRKSQLPEVFSQHTRLPISQIEDGAPVRRGHVHVIPPGTLLEIEQGVFRLRHAAERPQIPMPIDCFFDSLAYEAGPRAVAIVLSGANADGAEGVRAIKAQGGMAMAQEPVSAEHAMMPASAIRTGLVDYVLPVEQMPAALGDYLKHLGAMPSIMPTPEADAQDDGLDLQPVLDILLQTKQDFRGYKSGTLGRRVRRRMAIRQFDRFADYFDLLKGSPEEVEILAQDMMIGVTEFFRDPQAWAAFARLVIEPLLAKTPPDAVLRVWVPGCASGEEAYSVAMLLTEEIEKLGRTRRLQIFATDVNLAALQRGRLGSYPLSSAVAIGPARLARFFRRIDDTYQVEPGLRSTVVFSPQNLLGDPPFSKLDLITCRNLLIYLDAEAQQHVFRLFHFALNAEGCLFLGRSEGIDTVPTLFEEVSKTWRIYRRVGHSRQPSLGYRFGLPAGRRMGPLPSTGSAARVPGYAEVVNATLAQHYAPAAVLINRAYQVLYFSGATSEFLAQPRGEPTGDLLEMVAGGIRIKLRAALHQAMQEGAEPLIVKRVPSRDGSPIKLTVMPLREAPYSGDAILVTFERVNLPDLAPALVPEGGKSELHYLEQELHTVRSELTASVEQLESNNTELRVANEEIMSMNEELQSANEELETSKEELQSVNEEMETVNAQLEEKIIELGTLNDDLANLLASTRIATIFLDAELRIRRFTPPATAIFKLLAADVGRHIGDIAASLQDEALLADVQAVLDGAHEVVDREVENNAGTWYLRRISPYLVHGKHSAAVVVTYTDITVLKKAEERSRRLAAVVRDSNDAITVFSLDGWLLAWNRGASCIYGYTEDEALGLHIDALQAEGAPFDYQKLVACMPQGSLSQTYEIRRRAKNGRILEVLLTLAVLCDADGHAMALATTERDVTEARRASSELRNRADRLAEADRRKDEFIAMLGHELRNPLSAVRTAAEILDQDVHEAQRRVWAIGVVRRQTDALTRLVNDLLDISRITRGSIVLHRKWTTLREITDAALEVCRFVIHDRGHQLTVALPDEEVWIHADPARLSQALENLLVNASKYTLPGGSITLAAEVSPLHLAIRVMDNGVGIDRPLLDRLFEMFTRASPQSDRGDAGLGLGLAIARRMVEMQQGTISAYSAGPGKGAEFTIELPRQERIPSLPETVAEPQYADVKPKRILIIDDNQDAAEGLKLLLESDGHEVERRADGPSGLQASEAMRPDVILLDIGLPGMDGHAVARELRKRASSASSLLVALTGYGQPEDRQRALDAGFDHHLVKPVDLHVLKQLLAF